MSQYASWTDGQVLQAFEESIIGAWVDASGSEQEKNRSLINAIVDDVGRSDLGVEVLKRQRKWGQPPAGTPPGTMPPTAPIANPDRLAIVQTTQPNYTYLNA